MEQKKAYRHVPNINFIPLEYQIPTVSIWRLSLRVLLAIMIVVELLLIPNLYKEKSTIKANVDSAQQKIQQIDKILEAANTKKEEEQYREELGIKQVDWPQVMTTFFQSQPQGVELQNITNQGTTQVSVTGTAVDYATLASYQKKLLSSPVISRIISLRSNKSGSSVSFSLVAEVKTEEK